MWKKVNNYISFQKIAKSSRVWDFKVFSDLMNFDNLRRNILEFVAIIEMNFATDGQAVLGKRSFLISLYQGDTRRKWNFDSTIDTEQRRQILFSRGTLICLPLSISRLCALSRKAANSDLNLSFEIHSTYFSIFNSVLNWQWYSSFDDLHILAYQCWVKWPLIPFLIISKHGISINWLCHIWLNPRLSSKLFIPWAHERLCLNLLGCASASKSSIWVWKRLKSWWIVVC